MGNRGDTVSNRNQSGSLGPWPRYNRCLPRYLKLLQLVTSNLLLHGSNLGSYIEADKWTGHQQYHAEVAGSDVEGCNHYDTPGKRKKNGQNDMVAMLEPAARRPRHC